MYLPRVLLAAGAALVLTPTVASAATTFTTDERAILIERFDRDGDGSLSTAEQARAVGRSDRDGDGQLSREEAERLQRVARNLIVKRWLDALGSQTSREQRARGEQLEVTVSRSLNRDGTHVAFLYVRWGDLRRQQAGHGRRHYGNWDGSLLVTGAIAQVVDGIRFDDARGRLPRAGRGADRITSDQPHEITWDAGTVGGTDGLLIRVISHQAEFSGTLSCGGIDVPVSVRGLARGTELPDGSTAE